MSVYYSDEYLSNHDYLQHYGKKGMKWGVVNEQEPERKPPRLTSGDFLSNDEKSLAPGAGSSGTGDKPTLKKRREYYNAEMKKYAAIANKLQKDLSRLKTSDPRYKKLDKQLEQVMNKEGSCHMRIQEIDKRLAAFDKKEEPKKPEPKKKSFKEKADDALYKAKSDAIYNINKVAGPIEEGTKKAAKKTKKTIKKTTKEVKAKAKEAKKKVEDWLNW